MKKIRTGHTKTSKSGWRWGLAALVFLLLAWQLGLSLRRLDGLAFTQQIWRAEHLLPVGLVLLLMPLNWLLESWKWWLLLRPFHAWSFGRVWRATLAGVTLSAVTPNRLGEIGGRMLRARRAEMIGVAGSSLLGALCQWVVFLGLGGPALVWVAGHRWPELTTYLPVSLAILVILLVGLAWRGGYLLGRMLGWAGRRFGLEVETGLTALRRIRFVRLAAACGVGALRFGVYATQLFLLLGVFGLVLPWGRGMAGIAAIYLVQAGLPLPPGVNLLTRAELGSLLWGTDPATTAGSLAAFTTLFAINVLLPALVGHRYLLK